MFLNKCLNKNILFSSAPKSGIQTAKSSSKNIYKIVKLHYWDDYEYY